jgi:hypothetical protein
MFDTTIKLDVSIEQLGLIEASLHTQAKILNVQAEAGGQIARARLNAAKTLLTQLAQKKTSTSPLVPCSDLSWFSFKRCSPKSA